MLNADKMVIAYMVVVIVFMVFCGFAFPLFTKGVHV